MEYEIILKVRDNDKWLNQFTGADGERILMDHGTMIGTTAVKILNQYQDPEHLTFVFKNVETIGD